MVFVVSGIGGVGKSETIVQFLEKNKSEIRNHFWGVFWVDCSTKASAHTGFKRVCEMSGWPLEDSALLFGAKDRLASSNKCSLLVLDNSNAAKFNYARYIPSGGRVSVIMTTRLADANKYATTDPCDEQANDFVRLEGLDPDSALKLVSKVSEMHSQDAQTQQAAKRITAILGYHPLAITVACSLVKAGIYSLKEYADAIEHRITQVELLDEESEQAQYRKISTTFEMSAQVLERQATTDQSAAHGLALLDVLAFMHRQGVSEEIFKRAWDYEKHILSGHDTRDDDITHLSNWHVIQSEAFLNAQLPDQRLRQFRRARAHLHQLSLANLDTSTQTLSMHPLVHTWARLRIQRSEERWAMAASILALSCKGCFDWQLYSPQLQVHLETCFGYIPRNDQMSLDCLEVCRILYIWWWQLYMVSHNELIELSKLLLQQTSIFSTPTDMCQVTHVQYLLGLSYSAHGRVEKAQQLLEHVVKVQDAILAEDHHRQLASQRALGLTYLANGQVEKAVQLLEHVVKVQDVILIENDPSRLASLHALAIIYQANKQLEKAVQLLEHVTKIQDIDYEDYHPDRLNSQKRLAGMYLDIGQEEKAVKLLEHIIEVQDANPVDDHSRQLASKLPSQLKLIIAYLRNGEVDKAIQLQEQVIKVVDPIFVKDHPSLLELQHALADAHRVKRKTQVIQLLSHIGKETDEIFAENHPGQLKSHHALISTYPFHKQVEKAVQLLEHVVRVQDTIITDASSSGLTSQNALNSEYLADGSIDTTPVESVLQVLERIIELRDAVLAKNRPDQITIQHKPADDWSNSQVKNTVQQLEQIVGVTDAILPENHPYRLILLHALAVTYRANNQVEKAIQLLEHVVRVQDAILILADDHPSLLISKHALASAYQTNGQVKEAIGLLEQIERFVEANFADSRPDLLVSRVLLVGAYKKNGQVEEAKQLEQRIANTSRHL